MYNVAHFKRRNLRGGAKLENKRGKKDESIRKPICDIVFCGMTFCFRCFNFLLSYFEFFVLRSVYDFVHFKRRSL